MTFLEVLLEGASDQPAVREVLERRFRLEEGRDFRLISHRGRGKLPPSPLSRPDPKRRGLLDQLPAKLRGYAHLPAENWIVVLVDTDRDDCRELKRSLLEMYRRLPRKPPSVLFRIAVEETESWFLADPKALKKAFPRRRFKEIAQLQPDAVMGAWEKLAQALGLRPAECRGSNKVEWAEKISPHLDLDNPPSPSLAAFVNGIQRILGTP